MGYKVSFNDLGGYILKNENGETVMIFWIISVRTSSKPTIIVICPKCGKIGIMHLVTVKKGRKEFRIYHESDYCDIDILDDHLRYIYLFAQKKFVSDKLH